MTKSLLYLDDSDRKRYNFEISNFVEIINKRVFTIFENIEEESEQYGEEYSKKLFQTNVNKHSLGDPSDYLDRAHDASIAYYLQLHLMKYNLLAMSISTLYLMWEQQVRRFLYLEMRRVDKIDLTNFCTRGINEIKEIFLNHNVNLEELSSWGKVNEARLLSNVIKHGDGYSANELLKINKKLFKEDYKKSKDSLPIETTLLEETLNLSEELFNEYADNFRKFWKELPESSYCD